MNNVRKLRTSLEVSNYLSPLSEQVYVVESIYEQGFNLKENSTKSNQDRVYISCQAPLKRSVMGIQLTNEETFQVILANLRLGERLHLKEKSWRVYSRPVVLEIALDEVHFYDCELPSGKLYLTDIRTSELMTYIENSNLLEQSAFYQLAPLHHLYQEWIEESENSPLLLDSVKITRLIQKMIGKGLGLTPSGDDFLQGMMVMETMMSQENQGMVRIGHAVKQLLKQYTTSQVSLNYYDALFSGYANQAWVQLAHALIHHDSSQVPLFLQRIENYGHTSGKDMLLGVKMYIKLRNDLEGFNE
ncbi:DUF2877 domain-containing protein [Facklamia lactis]|uniref:DUF2877 domain-containing protein n=1 Tax=Facklamia lactis TaxID=2749967 RepID=UPI0018CF31D4|nr:DUF2877 domain-containing protein [Facklamia lactis]MBG9981124.1 DUF2877 domain-containing protein [Facklamia lactis]